MFATQDTRRFVLGFTLCGSIMRLWVFDRLGGVGSTSFNINMDGRKFVSVMLGFLWMNEEELGFDPTIIEGDDGRYMEIQRNSKTERVYIVELMKRQRSIAGRATTCWKGYVGAVELGDPLVIKDSWEYEDRPEEGLLLQEATKAGVENVARYYHYETVCFGGAVDDVLGSVRKRLNDDDGRNPFERRRTRLCNALASATTSGSSGQERGRGGTRGGTGGGSRGRAKSGSQNVSRKRSSSQPEESMPPPKRPCSDSLVDCLRRRNRVHRRVIMRDVGKSLYQASSLPALLTGLLGGVKGKFYQRARRRHH